MNNEPRIIRPANPSFMNWGRNRWITLAIVIVAIILFANAWHIVPAGHKGVKMNFGAVQPAPLDEGLNFKIPFYQTIVNVEVRVKKEESKQTAASADLQTVTTTLAVNYSLQGESVPKLYKSVGLDYEARIISPAVSEGIKSVTSKYKADDLIRKREEVSSYFRDMLAKRLGVYGIVVNDISITNFSFSTEYADAIEAKQVAEQQVLKANLDLQRIEVEKKQAIAQAQAQAESLKAQKEQVTPQLIELRRAENEKLAIEKWDGVLPKMVGGATPFVDLSGIINNEAK